ncbi:MAG: uracil-DNA glycosylase family protein [Pseudomonadota bacterium]
MAANLQSLVAEIRACQLCRDDMDRAPNPILRASTTARILIASQAPGNLADRSGVPFNDPSGRRLRQWMGVTDGEFYDERRVAIAPMGFCFPGYDKNGGDRPPMKRCAEVWRDKLLSAMPQIELVLLIGSYSQRWHLGDEAPKTLSETVARWTDYLARGMVVTPHPSWRNNAWLKRNPWFEAEVLPVLQRRVRALLS